MRFLDTNVLVYAFLKPKRTLQSQEEHILTNARAILKRIEHGEHIVSSVVHISEFVNIIQHRMNIETACEMLNALLALKNVQITGVERSHYHIAVEIAQKTHQSINDCLALTLMSEHNLTEIYSFDKDFDVLGAKRVTT